MIVVVPSNFTMSFPDDLVDVGDGKDDKENAVNQEKERIGSLLMKQISVRGHKNKSLNEQQRIQQIIKIGLPTKPSVDVSGALFIQNLTSFLLQRIGLLHHLALIPSAI